MTKTQYYIGDTPLLLGESVGRGGEGEVFLASNYQGAVVKIYTGHKNAQREAKVLSMVKHKLADKTNLVSFPKSIVRTKAGDFVGFAMNFVAGYRPLHQVYGPKSRKIYFPNADFRFLIRVAANIARAVGQVHQSSCVIGDLNESGILVSKDATVAFIDADSFQFEENGKHYPCLVGVPGFTPPELQGKSLNGVVRMKYHDYFGLAIAIFQLLFMGRHPYAGRHPDQNLSLEQSIAKNLFAYSRLRKTQMTPPPSIVTLDDFSSDVANSFERAFGVDHLSRPDPAEWIEVLKRLESHLSRCNANSIHYYPSSAKSCPWCKMEYSSGAVLFVASLKTSFSAGAIYSNFSIDKIWADIESISIPQINCINPKLATTSVVLPSINAKKSIASTRNKKKFAVLATIGVIIAWIFAPDLDVLYMWLVIFSVYLFFTASIDKSNFIERYKKADTALNDALDIWRERSGVEKLYKIRSGLENTVSEYRSLAILKSQALSQLMMDRRNNQLLDYLDRHLLSGASIPGIGSGKKMVLASYGIESAADVKRNQNKKIPGFGEMTTAKLVAWRTSIESKFVYNQKSSTADTRAKAKIEDEYNKKANALVKRLSSGGVELRQAWAQVQARITSSDSDLNRLAAELAQIEADLQFLDIKKPASASRKNAAGNGIKK